MTAKQHESPRGVEAIERFKAKHPEPGNLFSGGQLLHFQEGWARLILERSRVAHWYQRVGFQRIGMDQANTLCDTGASGNVAHLYGQGNYPRCGNCIKRMARLIREGRM